MEALKLVQELFAWTLVCPSAENLTWSSKLLRKMYTILVAISNITALIASIYFLNKLETADLESILYACYQIVSIVAGTYMLITALLLHQEIQDLFLSFHQMHDECELPSYIYIYMAPATIDH